MNVFVFETDLAGRHPDEAMKHGAIRHQPKGLQGESYAIPTKGHDAQPLPAYMINRQVNEFMRFAMTHPDYVFIVNKIGCGPNGYKDSVIGPMFDIAPSNCILPTEWEGYRSKA